MKQFIVLMACIPIMFSFVIEYTTNQIIYSKINTINDIVYTAKEQAKQDGCFTDDVLDNLKNEIREKADCECIVCDETTRVPKQRVNLALGSQSQWNDALIRYRIEVPIKEAERMSRILGIRNPKHYKYVIDSYTASEYVPEAQ